MNRKLIFSVIIFTVLAGCAGVGEKSKRLISPTVRPLIQSTRSWDGSLLNPYPRGQPEVTIIHVTILPGCRLDVHSHPVINAGVLLKGELTVVAENGKKLELKAGDPIVELVNTKHFGFNPGREPAEIIVFYAGIEGKAITVKEAMEKVDSP